MNESAGVDYNDQAQELKARAEQGEAVGAQSRGLHFVTSFVATMKWVARQHDKGGAQQVPWMAPEFYKYDHYKASDAQVGELVPHWKWRNKTESKPKDLSLIHI
eukprot:3645308-Pyramimonas_sp.AAC.1